MISIIDNLSGPIQQGIGVTANASRAVATGNDVGVVAEDSTCSLERSWKMLIAQLGMIATGSKHADLIPDYPNPDDPNVSVPDVEHHGTSSIAPPGAMATELPPPAESATRPDNAALPLPPTPVSHAAGLAYDTSTRDTARLRTGQRISPQMPHRSEDRKKDSSVLELLPPEASQQQPFLVPISTPPHLTVHDFAARELRREPLRPALMQECSHANPYCTPAVETKLEPLQLPEIREAWPIADRPAVPPQRGNEPSRTRPTTQQSDIPATQSAPAIASAGPPQTKGSFVADTLTPPSSLRPPSVTRSSVVQFSASSVPPRRSSHQSVLGIAREFNTRTAESTAVPGASPQSASHSLVPDAGSGAAIRELAGSAPEKPEPMLDQSRSLIDLPLKHPEQHWSHAAAHLVEAGFQDPSLGWIGVRAARDSAGLHAILVPASSEAERTLSAHLGGLNAYLANNQIQVEPVTLSSFRESGFNPSFRGETQQGSAHDERDHRGDRQQIHSSKRVDSASIPHSSASHHTLNRYEPGLLRAAAIGMDGAHISLIA